MAGHKILVVVADGQVGNEDRQWKPPEILFTAASAAARDALLGEIEWVLQASRRRRHRPCTRMLNKWGDG